MSWLRVDDRYDEHPKFVGWTDGQKWAWTRVLLYCARNETDGRVPDDVSLLPRSVSAALLERARKSGLLDVHDDGSLHVHDWAEYNPPRVDEDELEGIVREYLEANPQATANEVVKAIGHNRKRVLSTVRALRGGSRPGSRSGSGTGTAPVPGVVPAPVTRARSRTPTPLEPTSHTTVSGSETEATDAAHARDDDPVPAPAADHEADLERRRLHEHLDRPRHDEPARLNPTALLDELLAEGGTA